MQIAILAGGLATRLGDFTRNQAKSMVKVLGKPFLEYQLELLANRGIKEIVLCIGHLGEQIKWQIGSGKKYGVTIKYSLENKPLGTAGALKNAEPLLKNPFFTIYGDSYLFLDFKAVMSYFKVQNKLGLMTVYKNYDFYDRSNTAIERNLVKRYSKKERTKDTVYIDYGAHIFKKEVLAMIPENQFYSLEDLFIHLVERGELMAFEVKERFYEIGSFQGLKEFEEYVTERQYDIIESTNQDKSRRGSYRS
jgi:MurNAc alpha-1-phosphate uridylyltransferase